MKEIALIGINGPVLGNVLTGLLENNLSVDLFSTYPERVMLDTTNITVNRLDYGNVDTVRDQLTGFSTAVIANESNLQDAETDDLILKNFSKVVNGAIQAGVKRIVVVGGKDSEAFYLGELRRHEGLDYTFISTEGDYASAAVAAVIR